MRMTNMKLLSTRQVADLLGFSPRTISRWCREGKFSEAIKVGRVWRIRVDDVDLHIVLNRQMEKKLGR